MLIMDPGGALGEAGAGIGVAGGAPPEDAIGMATTQHKLQLFRFSQQLRASLLLFSADFKDFPQMSRILIMPSLLSWETFYRIVF